MSIETLSEFFDGELAPYAHIVVAAHVLRCARCTALLHDFQMIKTLLKSGARRARFHAIGSDEHRSGMA
ncbi:MAG: hypothetical protein ABR606_03760 [Vicinamibacterales bacterium]